MCSKDSWPSSERQMKLLKSEKQICERVHARSPRVLSRVLVCTCERVSELLGCIGILKRDWQRRSLLGEIVNRVEPVICSRQPWKGDGWFTTKLLRISKVLSDWFGPGPTSHWACEPCLFLNPRWSMCVHALFFQSLCFSAAYFLNKFPHSCIFHA